VKINVYNVRGQRVRKLENDYFTAGNHSVVWNGRDEHGKPASSGVYFYRMVADNNVLIRKMILLK